MVNSMMAAALRTMQKTSATTTNLGEVLIDWMRPLGKLTESSQEIKDVGDFASAVTDSKRLRKVIDGQIDDAFDGAVQDWLSRVPQSEVDMDVLGQSVTIAKAEYKKQLNRMVGGNQGLKHLTHNMPGRMRQQLESSVGEVSSVLREDVGKFLDDFNPKDGSYGGQQSHSVTGSTRGHLSLAKRPESAIKEHMEGLNQGLKEMTKDYIASSKWDSWEDFQRLNWNDHIMDRHHKLFKQVEAIPENSSPYDPALGGNSISNSKAKADLKNKMNDFVRENVPVFKKGELVRGDYINMLHEAGGGRYHYLAKNGDKFEVRMDAFGGNISGYREPSGFGIEGYAHKGKWHQGLPPDDLTDYAGNPIEINPDRVRHIVRESFNVGQLPQNELNKLQTAGVNTDSKLMSWYVDKIEDNRHLRFKKDVINKIPDAEKPHIQTGAGGGNRDRYTFSGHEGLSRTKYDEQKASVEKFLTGEASKENTNVMDALRVLDFGAEYSSESMSPQSLGLALGASRRAASLTNRAIRSGTDMGYVSKGSLFNWEQHMNDIGRKLKNPLSDNLDDDFPEFIYSGSEEATSMSGSMELSPFRKVEGANMMVRSDLAKNVNIDHFFEGVSMSESPDRTMKSIIKSALKMGDTLTLGQMQKSAIANNPNMRNKLTFVESVTRSLNNVSNQSPNDVLKKILPSGHSPEKFVDDLTDVVAQVDEKFKLAHGEDASVFLDFDGIEFDAAGNIIGDPSIKLFHSGFTGGVSTSAKQALKNNWALAAPLGPGFKFVYGGEKKEK